MTRTLRYAQAINEALHQIMTEDDRAFIIGQGVDNPWYVGSTATDLVKKFGRQRVIDPPISENGMNGFGIGAALSGSRPLVIHPRLDFMNVGLDQLFNQAANWSYVFRGQISVPLTVWGIINRGGEQGAQHSQATQAMLAHVPGLKVVMPATPYDAKGLMISAMRDPNPVMIIDDRWLYKQEGSVPEEMYEVPIGSSEIMREGDDVTIVATSWMTLLAREAADILEKQGTSVEIINLRSLTPMDDMAVIQSARKTGRVIAADAAWRTCGFAAEISARIHEACFDSLMAPVSRFTLPDAPAPSATSEEQAYYPDAQQLVKRVQGLIEKPASPIV